MLWVPGAAMIDVQKTFVLKEEIKLTVNGHNFKFDKWNLRSGGRRDL